MGFSSGCLELREEVSEVAAKGFGDFCEGKDCDFLFGALDVSDVVAGEAGFLCEPLLSEAGFHAPGTDGATQ